MIRLLATYIAYTIILFGTGCMSAAKIATKTPPGREYTGWFIGSQDFLFFVIKKGGPVKHQLALDLSSHYPKKCRALLTDSFFVYPNIYTGKKKFLVNKQDYPTSRQTIVICEARAILRRIDTVYINHAQRRKQAVLRKLNVSDGVIDINAVWLETFSDLENIILVSNSKKDTIRFINCQQN
jgi:hypothetical protein